MRFVEQSFALFRNLPKKKKRTKDSLFKGDFHDPEKDGRSSRSVFRRGKSLTDPTDGNDKERRGWTLEVGQYTGVEVVFEETANDG